MYFTSSADPLPVKLAALGADSPVEFLIKPVTTADFERLGYELFRYNILPVSQETFRATLIDEIFVVYGDDADPLADMMDAYWQCIDLYNERLNEWQLQEEQRVLDEASGAPKREPAPLPEYTMKIRERSRAQLFAEEVRGKSRRVRDLTIEMQTYEERQREGMARLIVAGWKGLKASYQVEDGIIPENVWHDVKAELSRVALRELYSQVFAGGIVTETEKGNSDLPPDSESPPSGSLAPSDVSEASDGSSTTSSTGQAPSGGSVVTTVPSLSSTTHYGGATPSSASSLTDADTATSPSA